MRARRTVRAASSGFTLVELLAAMTIGAVVLAAVAALIRNVGLSFEAGTRAVGYAERLMLAVERMSADFASARYVQRSAGESPRAVFAGGPKKVAFVAAAGVTAGPPGEEIVLLEVEETAEATRLVRRRAPWLGLRTPLQETKPGDAVILLEGRLQIAFSYADRSLVWKNVWAEAPDLPRHVRLDLRDRATGSPVMGPFDFEIRADAPPACAKADATPACVPSGTPPSPPSEPAGPGRSSRP